MNMKRTALALTVLVAFFTMSFIITDQDDPIYKNLKVLPKNITAPQMDSVMKSYTAALGVKCSFCHVRNDSTKVWDYASDARKHKLIARDMIKMTNEINDKYFDFTGKGSKDLNTALTVTCYTCHNGKPEPATKPELREQRPQQQGGPNWGSDAARPRPDSARKQ
jgi:hypothetical protein